MAASVTIRDSNGNGPLLAFLGLAGIFLLSLLMSASHRSADPFHNGARSYLPAGYAAYLEPDPAGLRAGLFSNPYNYANQNPFKYIDPSGLQAVPGGMDFGMGPTFAAITGAPGTPGAEFILGNQYLLNQNILGDEHFADYLAVLSQAGLLGVGPEASFAGAGAEQCTTLFRAVSQSEFEDALAFGFRPGPGSYETGKFFAENPQNALQWGNMMQGPGNFQVLQADFPNSAAAQFMRWERLDGIGPARFGTYDQLGQPKITPWSP